MKGYRVIGYLCLGALCLAGGCGRSCGDVWQDTKTCSRHMGRGLMALFGRHPDSAGPCRPEEFMAYEEEEFVPFADEDLYGGVLRGDSLALMQIDSDTPIPQSRVNPGEIGSAIPGVDGFMKPAGEQVAIYRNIHFETDDYAIKGAENRKVIQSIAAHLKKNPNLYLFVEGHCDERGPAAYNLSLGTRRANAVRNALVREGVHPDRLLTISYGKERPISNQHTATAWKQNRRGQFKLHSHHGDSLCAR